MPSILSIDTSTEYCSVAYERGNQISTLCEHVPRQHNQRLFTMLVELLGDGELSRHGIDLLAWNCGPGSFTGLRIAASAVQGMAFAHGLPVVGVSTLACIAQGQFRRGSLREGDRVLVVLDARINEIYHGLYEIENGLARPLLADAVGPPDSLPLEEVTSFEIRLACGDGLEQVGVDVLVTAGIEQFDHAAVPQARDIIPLAHSLYAGGGQCEAHEVQPVYLREEIGWKKLADQGRKQ